MTLYLYDTLQRKKRAFQPREQDRITLYVCGPTVYDYAHIGNARPPVVFDVLNRLLRRMYEPHGYQVIYARNVTDVDDKINQKAAKEGVPIGEITARYEAAYLEDMARLNVRAPDIAPHVTDHMDAIVRQIGAILEAGAAYAAEGHVLFDVSAYGNYGRLSGRSLDDMIAGARVEIAPYKRNAHDFVLWKPSKEGEPSWPSPWGEGRPGWHIECSAMIEETLGLPIDIHGGGIDLVFPHHENEIAQGVCAHGHAEDAEAHQQYARYWMHNGFLTVDAEKMSKSIGNVLLLHDLVQAMPGEVVRWALLSAHYRQPLDWNQGLLDQSRKTLDRLYAMLMKASDVEARALDSRPDQLMPTHPLLDDINTPQALSALGAVAKEMISFLPAEPGSARYWAAADAKHRLLDLANLLGVLQHDPLRWIEGDIPKRARQLVSKRSNAKKRGNYSEADALRHRLDRTWFAVKDTPSGSQIVNTMRERNLEQLARKAFEDLWGPTEAALANDAIDFWVNMRGKMIAVEVKSRLPSSRDIERYLDNVADKYGSDLKVIFALPLTPENQRLVALKADPYGHQQWSFALFDGSGQIRSLRLGEW